MKFPAALLALLACVSTGHATAPATRAAGTYSSIHRIPSEDDVGMRVVIGYSNRGWYAILQCAGGNVDRPVVVTAQVDEDKRTVRFARHDDPDNECPQEAFSGRYGAGELKLTFPGGYDPGVLRRSPH